MGEYIGNYFTCNDDSYNRYDDSERIYIYENLDSKIELANNIDSALVDTLKVQDVKPTIYKRKNKPKIQVVEMIKKKIKTPKNLPKQVGNNFRKYLIKIPNLNQTLKNFKNKKETNNQANYSLNDFRILSRDPIAQQVFSHYLNTQAYLDLLNSKKEGDPAQHIKYLEVYASGIKSEEWNSHHNQFEQPVETQWFFLD